MMSKVPFYKRAISFLLGLLCLLMLCSVNAEQVSKINLTKEQQVWVAENPLIYVGVSSDWPPFEYQDVLGNPRGIDIDILNLISARTGLNFEIKSAKWSDNLASFKAQQLDLLIGVKYLQEREAIGHYSSAYLQVLDYFFAHQRYADTPFSELTDKRIAIPREYATSHFIRDNFPHLQLLVVDTLYDAIDAVIEGKADLLFNNYQTVSYILTQNNINDIVPKQSMRHTGRTGIHLLSRHSKPILAEIIEVALQSITLEEKENLSRLHMGLARTALFERFERANIEFTDQEKAYLLSKPVITMTGDPNWLPYEGLDEQGNYVGIVPDMLDLFEERLGIVFKREIGPSWIDSVKLFESNQVDVISETYQSDIGDNTLYTNAYLSSPIVLIMRDKQQFVGDYRDVAPLELGLIENYGYTKQVEQSFPNKVFFRYGDIDVGLNAVATGKVDVLFATLAQASYHMASQGMNNLRIVGQTPFKTELSFGTHKDNQLLVSILNKALLSVSQNEKQAIVQRWGDEKFVSRVDYTLVLIVFLIAVVLLILIVSWYQKLFRETQARQEAQAHYKLLLESLPSQVMVVNLDGIIEDVNKQVLEDYQCSAQQLIGQPFVNLLNEPRNFTFFSNMIEEDGIEQLTIEFKWQNQVHAMMLSMLPISVNNKPALLTLVVDITSRVTMEKMIIDARNSAIEANNAKSSFLANMSHEIRTPMNAIIGFSQLLSASVEEPKAQSYLKTIRSAGNSLLVLINDILDLSKVEAGKLQLQLKTTNLSSLLREVIQIFEIDTNEKSIELHMNIDPYMPNLKLDEARLRQVLFNLVGNAVKFTQRGKIELNVELTLCNDDLAVLKVAVSDTGVGISPQAQKTIFDSFTQANEHKNVHAGGTGLGLAISKRLIELMGGELTVTSELNRGSTFAFTLPNIALVTDEVTKKRLSGSDTIQFMAQRILVVDDVEDNRALLKQWLTMLGLVVESVSDGQAAIDATSDSDFDLVLLDLKMAGLSGHEAASVIKQRRPKLPIVAVSASSSSEQIDYNDFVGYLSKPILQSDLIDELKKHLAFSVVQFNDNAVESNSLILSYEIVSALTYNYELRAKKVLERNSLDEIKNFADDLTHSAQQLQCPELISFCQQLLIAVECFDVIEIQNLMESFISQFKDESGARLSYLKS
ncbi:transporter substrate-binding domain-containing protein [Psychrobium sp. MM17-31]|uniref:ATP-binding protein n=1 Tax=Psychrobium sp. MM17-31 TaxID=2917758 RepID=UPI001EF572E4|nr:transporter substrate-binding domain-containing protein [Psychrobium sp. MM17-31]MCG7531644.1 transporter substrate-binding domain-containing protein [Psychrobium sp. MM17-31]